METNLKNLSKFTTVLTEAQTINLCGKPFSPVRHETLTEAQTIYLCGKPFSPVRHETLNKNSIKQKKFQS